jgi:hypothetical protein
MWNQLQREMTKSNPNVTIRVTIIFYANEKKVHMQWIRNALSGGGFRARHTFEAAAQPRQCVGCPRQRAPSTFSTPVVQQSNLWFSMSQAYQLNCATYRTTSPFINAAEHFLKFRKHQSLLTLSDSSGPSVSELFSSASFVSSVSSVSLSQHRWFCSNKNYGT